MAECQPKHVIRHECGQVTLCEHGTVTLTLGNVTLRLSRAEFDRHAALIHDAAEHFRTSEPTLARSSRDPTAPVH